MLSHFWSITMSMFYAVAECKPFGLCWHGAVDCTVVFASWHSQLVNNKTCHVKHREQSPVPENTVFICRLFISNILLDWPQQDKQHRQITGWQTDRPVSTDKIDMGRQWDMDFYKKQEGERLCHGRGRPMKRRGPRAPADHNRGLIMSA